jgi:hypothetical protein
MGSDFWYPTAFMGRFSLTRRQHPPVLPTLPAVSLANCKHGAAIGKPESDHNRHPRLLFAGGDAYIRHSKSLGILS